MNTKPHIVLAALSFLLLSGLQEASAKEEYKKEGARTVITHQATREREILKGLTTKRKLPNCPSLSSPKMLQIQAEFLAEGLTFPASPVCFKTQSFSVLVDEQQGVCASGPQNGQPCMDDATAVACVTGGGTCVPSPQCWCEGWCRDSTTDVVTKRVNAPATDIGDCDTSTTTACTVGEVFDSANCY